MYNSFSQLSPDCDDPILCVKLRKKWRSVSTELLPDSLELLLLDIQGSTIQASINKDLVPKFDDLLSEGDLYDLRGFNVIAYSKSNDMTDIPYVIVFLDETFVAISDYPFFKESVYIFKPFPDILCYSTFCDGPLFDVIGTVVDFDERLDSEGCMRLMLQDLENNRLLCLISNPHLPTIMNSVRLCKSGKYKCFVIIFQLCRKIIYKGEVCVSASLTVTDLICNPFIDEIESYWSRINLKNYVLTFDGAKLLSPHIKSAKTELCDPGITVYSIKHLSYCEEVIKLWTIVTITNIHRDRGWYSIFCPSCTDGNSGIKFHVFCSNCERNLIPFAQFRVFIDVVDYSGAKACFILEHEVATFLIESTVTSLINIHRQIYPRPDVPKSVNRLIGREVLFKVKLSSQKNIPTGGRVYDVENCCSCPILIEQYKSKTTSDLDLLESEDEYLDSDDQDFPGESSSDDHVT